MNLTEIVSIRLLNQQIEQSQFEKPEDTVKYMGAMQAQDFNMVQWAVGLRLDNTTQQRIMDSYNKGEILRTHLMRPTWHLVSSQDINWMLNLTAPRIKSISKARWKELELTESVFKKCDSIIEKALSIGEHLTRNQLKEQIEKAKINTAKNRLSHILLRAELDGLICSGTNKGKNITYALFSERVSRTNKLSKEEALAALANRYFTSHGPATLDDFIWWSGLVVKDAAKALELIKDNFISETIDSQTYWFKKLSTKPKSRKSLIYLLPAFDEFIIGYKNRLSITPNENYSKAISKNGMFYPVIIINGKTAGLWKRVIKKDKIIIEAQLFEQPNSSINKQIIDESKKIGKFLGKEAKVII